MDEMKLDSPEAAAGGATHDVELNFAIKQSGSPFLECKVSYHHCTDPVVAYIVGSITSMAGPLGPKGKKAKDGAFAVDMSVLVDGTQTASGAWDGLSREGSLLFEKQVLDVWSDMNKQATIQAKAYGKI